MDVNGIFILYLVFGLPFTMIFLSLVLAVLEELAYSEVLAMVLKGD